MDMPQLVISDETQMYVIMKVKIRKHIKMSMHTYQLFLGDTVGKHGDVW